MTAPRLCLPVAAGLLLLALSGCSGSSPGGREASADPSTSAAQFCGALTDFRAGLANADPTDPTAFVQALKAAATRLDAVGVPAEMPTDARTGFEKQVAAISDLPATPTSADLAAVGQAASDPALETYVTSTCPDL